MPPLRALGLLRQALQELPLREREAFVLCELEGQTTTAAAQAMQVQGSSVRSLLSLARRRLRNLLGPHLVGSPDGQSEEAPR